MAGISGVYADKTFRRLEGRRNLIRALCLGSKPALWIARAALAIQEKKERA
jgi:hypothetical protein